MLLASVFSVDAALSLPNVVPAAPFSFLTSAVRGTPWREFPLLSVDTSALPPVKVEGLVVSATGVVILLAISSLSLAKATPPATKNVEPTSTDTTPTLNFLILNVLYFSYGVFFLKLIIILLLKSSFI